MIIDGARSVPEREALDTLRLRERVRRYSFGTLSGPDESVYVIEGDLRIEGDLELEQLGVAGLIVEGNLEVNGSVINEHSLGCDRTAEGAGIPFLLVGGNLRARNVAVGTSQVVVEGDADIEEVLFLHDIESELHTAGTLRVGRVINTFDFPAGVPLSDHLHRDVPITYGEDYGVAVEGVDENVVIERMRAGLPLLRDAGDSRPRKSYERWLEDCAAYGDVLRHVPQELIDTAMCLAAVKSWGLAIEYVPRELVTDELVDAALAESPWALQAVPAEFCTPERCRIGVQHSGRMLANVPEELRTPELCALAIERDSHVNEVFPSIPEKVLTPELCLRAAQRDGYTLRFMPERFRTFEVCVAALRETLSAAEHIPDSIGEAVVKAVFNR